MKWNEKLAMRTVKATSNPSLIDIRTMHKLLRFNLLEVNLKNIGLLGTEYD